MRHKHSCANKLNNFDEINKFPDKIYQTDTQETENKR